MSGKRASAQDTGGQPLRKAARGIYGEGGILRRPPNAQVPLGVNA